VRSRGQQGASRRHPPPARCSSFLCPQPTLIDEEDAVFTQKQTGTEEACWFQALAQFELSDYDAKKGLPYVG
jgi:hypothetical protein